MSHPEVRFRMLSHDVQGRQLSAESRRAPRARWLRRAVLLGLGLLAWTPAELLAQPKGPWLMRLEGGYYEMHLGGGGGFAPAVHVGRRLGDTLIADARLTWGTRPTDDYLALEVALEAHLPIYGALAAFAGGGAGVMAEGNFSSVGLPFFGVGGLELDLDGRNRLRASVRRGSHGSTGDSGRFRGPHLLGVGWVHSF